MPAVKATKATGANEVKNRLKARDGARPSGNSATAKMISAIRGTHSQFCSHAIGVVSGKLATSGLYERLGVTFIPWYPLGDGAALRSRGVKGLAGRLGVPPAQVALAWLLAHSPVVLPIPGTASIAHLEENTAAAALRIPPEDLAALN